MEYLLSITSLIDTDAQGNQLRSRLIPVMAETDLGKDSEFGFPCSFSGRLVDITEEQFLYFKFDSGVEVNFRGMRYKFEKIEKDGEFQLRKAC